MLVSLVGQQRCEPLVGNSRASPEMGCRDGSMHRSWQTSVMTLAVKSLSSLCLMVGRPPVGQLRAWSVEKAFPQMRLLGRWVGCQLYRMHKASRNATIISNNNYSTRPGYGTVCGTLPLGHSSQLLRCILHRGFCTLVLSIRIGKKSLKTLASFTVLFYKIL